ncbi:unnamed protein product [Strongylus vulgaris]|uniref:Uncharacterized protein n=1 Tax=Strongylus vulgaris TaxID=40348 RepID=A0A3P7JJC1_STRVU|nr:unnamed protein product [Strongylus vulgaris]
MLDSCCRSQYYDGRIELVGMERHEFSYIPFRLGIFSKEKIFFDCSFLQADSVYDAIDMVFETLFYIPVLCMLNGFTMIMLYTQWNTIKKRQSVESIPGKTSYPRVP